MKLKFLFAVFVILLLAPPATADWDLKGFEWSIVIEDDSIDVAVGRSDHRRIENLRRTYREPFVWVRRGNAEWVITDRLVVNRLRGIMETPDEMEIARSAMESERRALEDSMREFEQLVARASRNVNSGSIEKALEIAEAARELKTEKLEAAARRMEQGARELEHWMEELEASVEEEAVPLIEESIRSGVAKRLR